MAELWPYKPSDLSSHLITALYSSQGNPRDFLHCSGLRGESLGLPSVALAPVRYKGDSFIESRYSDLLN